MAQPSAQQNSAREPVKAPEGVVANIRPVQPRGAGAGPNSADSGGDVFLSPRVVDQRAFEELSSVLRGLLSEVRDEAGSLRAALSDAKSSRGDIDSATEKQRHQLELTAKLLKALSAKADAVEQASRDAEQRLERFDTIGDKVDGAIASRFKAFEERLDAKIAEANAARDAAVRAIDQAGEMITSLADERIENVTSRCDEQLARADAAAKKVSDAQAEGLLRVNAAARQKTAEIESAASSIDQKIAEATERATNDFDQAIADRVKSARDQLAAVTSQIDAMRQEFESGLGSAANAARDQLEGIVTRAEALTGATPQDGVQPLAHIMHELERVSNEAQRSLARVNQMRDESAAAVGDLEDRLAESKMLLDLAGTRQEKASQSLNETIATVENAERRMVEQSERAKEVMEPIAQIRDEAREEAERLLRVQEEVAQSIDVNRTTANSVRSLMIELRDAASRLEPWRDLLIGRNVRESDLPKPLLDIVHRFRESLARDLSKMASAMSLVASQAQTGVRMTEDGPEVVIRGAAPANREPQPVAAAAASEQASETADAPAEPQRPLFTRDTASPAPKTSAPPRTSAVRTTQFRAIVADRPRDTQTDQSSAAD